MIARVTAPLLRAQRRCLSVDTKAFCDRLRLRARGGKGGRGAVGWEAQNKSRGRKPSGGSGGNGGDVVVKAVGRMDMLDATQRFARAEAGGNGGSSMCRGRDAPPLYVEVPRGTAVTVNGTTHQLDTTGEEILVATGTKGARGNGVAARKGQAFGLSASAAPADVLVELVMTLAADVALVGAPNVGKSSLLKALSKAEPKVAPYPFTTLHPVIGVVEYDNGLGNEDVVRVLDVPGIIEGAADGRGLGDDFLRHVARCASALHVVDASSDDPVGDLLKVRGEVLAFAGADLAGLPFRVLLSKCDLVTSERLAELETALGQYDVSAASTASGANLGDVALQLRRLARDGSARRTAGVSE